MIPVLTSDSYRGVSTNLTLSGVSGAQPIFIGRLVWPGTSQVIDAVIKLYAAETCGVANEAIGYIVNNIRGIAQPAKSAILLLSIQNLSGLSIPLAPFLDKDTGLIACWATSLEQNTTPFRYVRKLSTFSTKQIKIFYKSKFCKKLASVDFATGNNDRHEGNFLYIDDLNYLAIDQGCIGGGIYWNKMFLDNNPTNDILELTKQNLATPELAAWQGDAIMEHVRTQQLWASTIIPIRDGLSGLLDEDEMETILTYIGDRVTGEGFKASCGKLI